MYLDWRFRVTTWFSLAVALVCVGCAFILPESCGAKNSMLENAQMLILGFCLYLTCTARPQTPLYVFISLVLFLVLAREVNFGRTLFIFADPQNACIYPKWKDIEYGWLAHIIVGLYMLWMLVYFFWRRVWYEMWSILKNYGLPVPETLLAGGSLLISLLCDSMHHCLAEELSEVVLYVVSAGIIYLYSRKKLVRFE